MKYGFYCRMYGKDCFIETTQTKRTKKLAEDFIRSVKFTLNWSNILAVNDADIKYVQNAMKQATFEIKTIENGNFAELSYYEINGENFSYGCDACENPMEKCILV